MAASLRKIAQRTGLSVSTVSLALRGIGRLSEETREKVRSAASEMAYQSNPLMSKALSMARRPKGDRYRETLAFILEYPTETGPDYQKAMQTAAEERAMSMSCKLETFILSGKPSDHRRWSRIFEARGIRGLIIIPRLEHRQPRLMMNWDKFASVEIGRTLWNPRNLHRIESGGFHNLVEAMHLLKKVGYRRIGMAVEPFHDYHNRGIYFAPFLLVQQRFPLGQRIPILAGEGEWSEKVFKSWMKTYKPDVLIVHSITDICRWLQQMKVEIPGDISLFNINVRSYDDPGPHRNYECSGLRRDYAGMGKRAVEMVSHFLLNGEIGLVGNPSCWALDEFWMPGKTLAHSISAHISPEGFLKSRTLRTQQEPMVPIHRQ